MKGDLGRWPAVSGGRERVSRDQRRAPWLGQAPGQVEALFCVGEGGPTGFELRIGDRRVPFGFAEARELVERWPGWLGSLAAQQAAVGGPFQFTLGGQVVRLDANQARQLAGLPSQLRWLLGMAETMRCSRTEGEKVR